MLFRGIVVALECFSYWGSTSEVGYLMLSSVLVSANFSEVCANTLWSSVMEMFTMSVMVKLAMHKYGTLSINPMGREKCNPTNCGSSGCRLGIRNLIDEMSSKHAHIFM